MRVLFLFFLLLVILKAQACEVIDDAGNRVNLTRPAQRIISLAPDLTENLFALGAGEQIVGVIQASDYPLQAKKIPIVASFNSVNLEKIISLHPDLIVVWGEGQLNESLKKLSIPVYVNHPQHISDVPKMLERLGCLTGHEAIARALNDKFNFQYDSLKKKYARQKKVKVFYEVWQQPLITIGDSSWINDAIKLCGGENIFTNLKIASPAINLEAVLSKNPQVIISASANPQWQAYWHSWPKIAAVSEHHLYTIQADTIERVTPRILKGVAEICEALDKTR